jgi:predicted PurR-regulated permease PerM
VTLQRQISFWILAAAAVVLLLFVFSNVLLPFVAGIVLAYLLDPLADRLQRAGFSRLFATIIILVLFVLGFALLLVLGLPILINQVVSFSGKLPGYVDRLQQLVAEQGRPIFERLGGSQIATEAENSLGTIVTEGAGWVGKLVGSIWSGGQAVVSVFALLVITPVVTFYLLVDWDDMIAKVDSWLPLAQRPTIRELASEMDRAIAGFIRGQAIVCLLLGLFYAVGLSLIGLNFGVLIGLTSGFLSFIPYVGSLTGLVLSVGVAVVQFWPEWIMPLAALAIFATGQFLEGNIIQPKFVGDAVGLHPVWLMFALLAFGSLFGFVGLLVAVPLAAIVGVLARFALRQYLASPLYRGTPHVDNLQPSYDPSNENNA